MREYTQKIRVQAKHTRCQWKFQCVKWEIINRKKKKKKHEIKKTTTTTGGNVKLKLKSIQTWIVLCAWVWDLDSGIIFFSFLFFTSAQKKWNVSMKDLRSWLYNTLCFFFYLFSSTRVWKYECTHSYDLFFFSEYANPVWKLWQLRSIYIFFCFW